MAGNSARLWNAWRWDHRDLEQCHSAWKLVFKSATSPPAEYIHFLIKPWIAALKYFVLALSFFFFKDNLCSWFINVIWRSVKINSHSKTRAVKYSVQCIPAVAGQYEAIEQKSLSCSVCKIKNWSLAIDAGPEKKPSPVFYGLPQVCAGLYAPLPSWLLSLWARLPAPRVLRRLRGWGATRRNRPACWPARRCPTAAVPPPHGRPGTARHTENVEISTWINMWHHFAIKSARNSGFFKNSL